MTTRILTGDARRVLAELVDGSVGMCLTSPPYYGLRDYGHDDQIGLEATPEAYVQELVAVFREVRRVLRDDGTLWLNLGDSYAASGRGGNSDLITGSGKDASKVGRRQSPEGLKSKDLIGVPWMVAFALRADGWYLRQEIIWSKNGMPESVRDRCTKSHEHVFLLAKQPNYFFDADAIAEPAVSTAKDIARARITGRGTQAASKASTGVPQRDKSGGFPGDGMRNCRSVWNIATQPSGIAHFATMAPALAERCIRAGTSEHGCCASCGARWKRQTRPLVDVGHTGETASAYAEGSTANRLATLRQAARELGTEYTGARVTVGWSPCCTCADTQPPVRDSVLDPFGGAGTTALVADRLQRDAVLVELNPGYAHTAADRVRRDASLFTEVINA